MSTESGGMGEVATLNRAEAKLLSRANAMRRQAIEADERGESLRAAALRGKAVGLHEGAHQIASIAADISGGCKTDRKCAVPDCLFALVTRKRAFGVLAQSFEGECATQTEVLE